MITDSSNKTLEVVDRAEILADFLADHRLSCQGLYRIESCVNFVLINQRLLYVASEKTCSHRRARFIKDP